MNDEVKKKLEAAISACAGKAADARSAIDALQYTQAALNATNALIGLTIEGRAKKATD